VLRRFLDVKQRITLLAQRMFTNPEMEWSLAHHHTFSPPTRLHCLINNPVTSAMASVIKFCQTRLLGADMTRTQRMFTNPEIESLAHHHTFSPPTRLHCLINNPITAAMASVIKFCQTRLLGADMTRMSHCRMTRHCQRLQQGPQTMNSQTLVCSGSLGFLHPGNTRPEFRRLCQQDRRLH
jgi:hypothetical protein